MLKAVERSGGLQGALQQQGQAGNSKASAPRKLLCKVTSQIKVQAKFGSVSRSVAGKLAAKGGRSAQHLREHAEVVDKLPRPHCGDRHCSMGLRVFIAPHPSISPLSCNPFIWELKLPSVRPQCGFNSVNHSPFGSAIRAVSELGRAFSCITRSSPSEAYRVAV
jgi:hypothetical protein